MWPIHRDTVPLRHWNPCLSIRMSCTTSEFLFYVFLFYVSYRCFCTSHLFLFNRCFFFLSLLSIWLRYRMISTIKLEPNHRRRGRTINWQDLYFPMGCGKVKDGVPANIPLMRQTDGSFIPVRVFRTIRIVQMDFEWIWVGHKSDATLFLYIWLVRFASIMPMPIAQHKASHHKATTNSTSIAHRIPNNITQVCIRSAFARFILIQLTVPIILPIQMVANKLHDSWLHWAYAASVVGLCACVEWKKCLRLLNKLTL